MKSLLKNYFISTILLLMTNAISPYGTSCQWYTDEFGPLKTGYTMGDLVRYTVYTDSINPQGLNVYYGLVYPPLGAQDIFNFGLNTYNLYNALGYLYAGFNASNAMANPKYRIAGQGAREQFDNNTVCAQTVRLPTKIDLGDPIVAGYSPIPGDSTSSLNNGLNEVCLSNDMFGSLCSGDSGWANPSNANASCGWCPNTDDGDYVLMFQNEKIPSVIYPTAQFFGGRIANILGAVVNDVPWGNDDASEPLPVQTIASNQAYVANLLSGSKRIPMLAVMSGNTAGWVVTGSGATATSTSPVGMFQPSTAHFGSLKSLFDHWQQISSGGLAAGNNYVLKHVQPMIDRLSTLCSYTMSNRQQTMNYIQINDEGMTSYDNGVIVAIQNNTKKELEINQVSSTGSMVIGKLKDGRNNYYLHTASLISSQDSSNLDQTSSGQVQATPDAEKMISIIYSPVQYDKDSSQDIIGGVYIQILSVAQLETLNTAINNKLSQVTINTQSLPPLNYNQIMNNYTVPSNTPAYIVVTNFNPTLDSSNNLSSLNLPADMNSQADILNSYRVQAINIAEFQLKPYYLTIQINKENLGYGVQTDYKLDASGNIVMNANNQPVITKCSISSGSENSFVLFPSISSVSMFSWQNYVHKSLNAESKNSDSNIAFSKIPLLLMPDYIFNENMLGSNYYGLKAYYTIWLMAYAAAMNEFSIGSAEDLSGVIYNTNNPTGLINKAFNLTEADYHKVIIDQQGNLLSGKTVKLGNSLLAKQTMSLCACDTWDSGGGFNQDIPILNFSSDDNGNILVNNPESDYINLVLTFELLNNSDLENKLQSDYFKYRGFVYNNNLFFSVPKQALEGGVNVKITQTGSGNYQLIITNTQSYTDINSNLIQPGSVLVAQKIYIDQSLFKESSLITIDFLHTISDSKWSSPFAVLYFADSAKPLDFVLSYEVDGSKNILKSNLSKKVLPSLNPNIIKFGHLYPFDLEDSTLLSFNFNSNNYGYTFISNPWTGTSKDLSADIINIIKDTSNFNFAVVAVDEYNNLIFNADNIKNTSSFNIYIFDKDYNLLANPIAMPVTSCFQLSSEAITKENVINDLSSSFYLGIADSAHTVKNIVTLDYPFILGFKNINVPKPAVVAKKIKKISSKKKVQPPMLTSGKKDKKMAAKVVSEKKESKMTTTAQNLKPSASVQPDKNSIKVQPKIKNNKNLKLNKKINYDSTLSVAPGEMPLPPKVLITKPQKQ